MKTTKTVETTIKHELSASDVLALLEGKDLIPKDWQFFSVEIVGLGVSKGATLTLKNTAVAP